MATNYNGVELEPITTTAHTYGPTKDTSGSDQLFTESKLTFRAVINLAYSPAIAADLFTGGGASSTLIRIRHLLTQPRRPFYYDVTSPAGQRIGPAIFNISDGRDDAGGPWPDDKAFTVEYTTQGSFEVSWSVCVKIRDCGASTPDAEHPLSLRWEDSISWDETWKATFHRQGTLIISSRQQRTIDWFRRNRLGLPVTSGFQRTQAKYLCSRDGLRCDFNFTDEQLSFAPPYPGVKMRIVQSESGLTVGGMKKGSVAVVMVGMMQSNVRDLASWALLIMKARVWATNKVISQGIVPGTINLETEESSDKSPTVTATCQYKVQPDGVRETDVASTRNWGATVGLLVGGIPGAVIGARIGRVANPPKTEQNKTPIGTSPYPWIGFGTSPATIYNPNGYANWADPNKSVGGQPADGVGTAAAVSLFAALLNDPCGNLVSTTPYAQSETQLELTLTFPGGPLSNPPQANTPAAGQAGQAPYKTAELTAASSKLNAAQYPTTVNATDKQGFTRWDGVHAVYDYWQCLNEYIDGGPGTIILPTADPNGLNVQVEYQSQMITLIKRWAAKRVGAAPTLPSKTPLKYSTNGQIELDTNFVYVGGKGPQVRELGIAPDGVNIIYEASGYYVYQALDPTKVSYDAEVPPTLDQLQLTQVKQWANNLQTTDLTLTASTPGGTPSRPLPGGTGGPVLGSNSLSGSPPISGSPFFGVGSGIGSGAIQSPSGGTINWSGVGSGIGSGATSFQNYVPPPAGDYGFGANDPILPTFGIPQSNFVGPPTDPFFTLPPNPPPLGANALPPTLPSVPAPY